MGEPRSAGQQPPAAEAAAETDLENAAGEPGPGGKRAAPQQPPPGAQPDVKYQGSEPDVKYQG